ARFLDLDKQGMIQVALHLFHQSRQPLTAFLCRLLETVFLSSQARLEFIEFCPNLSVGLSELVATQERKGIVGVAGVVLFFLKGRKPCVDVELPLLKFLSLLSQIFQLVS